MVDAMERGIETALVAPVAVSSGHTAESALRVHNMTTDTIIVVTKGYVTGVIVDPRNGRGVGSGAQSYVTARMSDPDTGLDRPVDSQAQIVSFPVTAGGTEVIPLLVATASGLPDLGYAIPRRGLGSPRDPGTRRWQLPPYAAATDHGGGLNRPGNNRPLLHLVGCATYGVKTPPATGTGGRLAREPSERPCAPQSQSTITRCGKVTFSCY